MSDKIIREQIGKNVYFSVVTDKRFKKNLISVNFITDLSKETASVNALIPNLLVKTNKNYPDFSALNTKLSSIYGANLYCDVRKMGDSQVLNVSISGIDDRYALEGEKITAELCKIITDCIFDPYLENGVFCEKDLEVEKENLIQLIESELNEKRVYAINKAYETLCAGEGAGLQKYGYTDDVGKITSAYAYEAYKNLLSETQVEIICTGFSEFEEVKEVLSTSFNSVVRSEEKEYTSRKSPLKGEVANNTERMDVNQSKLVLGFKISGENRHANRILQKIYGGTTTSKLFLNVREKLSLCYYCAARYNSEKGVLMVDCGVESANIEAAKKEILNQLDDIKNGNFTDEDIKISALDVMNTAKTTNDSLGGIESWYLSRIYIKEIKSPEDDAAIDFDITKEQVIEAAKTAQLDTIYLLTSQN